MLKFLHVILCLIPSFAFAVTTSGDSIKYVFDEVSVVGSATSGDLRKATSSFDKVEIDESKSKSLANAVKNIPGIFLQQRSGGEPLSKITMRGFGTRTNDPQIVGIKILIDGFPETEPDGRTSLDLLDVSAYSQIEIGKTNSYNLFSPASGGYLNFISERNFSDSFTEERCTFGSFGFQKYQIEAGSKLKSGSIFLNMSNSKYEGWREHSASYSTNFNFYLKNQLDELSSFNFFAAGVSSTYKISGPLTRAQLSGDESKANIAFIKRDERRSNKILRIGLSYQKYFNEEESLTSSFFLSPKVLMRSQKMSYRDFNRLHLGGKIQYSFVKKYGEEDVNRFMVGLDNQYQAGPSLFYSLSLTNERGTALKQNKNEAGLNYGVYVHDEHTYKNLTIDLSLRYSHSKYLLDNFLSPELSDNLALSSFTPGAGISFAINDNNFIMLHYAKGVENPAFNEVDPPDELDTLKGLNPLLKPATSHTFEAGIKGDYLLSKSFVNRFTYNIIAYSILTYGELIPYQSNATYFLPSGKTKRYGIETSFSLSTEYFINFESSVTLSKNYFIDYKNISGNYNGKLIPGVPSRMIVLNIGYQNPLLPFLNLQYENLSQVYIDNANSVSAESYSKFDLQILYSWVIRPVFINCFIEIKNALNKKYISSVFVNGSAGEYFEPGMPRNISAGFSVHYQF